MTITPSQKGRAAATLVVASVVSTSVGLAIVGVPLAKGMLLPLVVSGPLSVFLFWLAVTFLRSWLNTGFSTTTISLLGDQLHVSNSPFGLRKVIDRSEIKSVAITDILSKRICLDLLITTKDNRVYSLCSFRSVPHGLMSLIQDIKNENRD